MKKFRYLANGISNAELFLYKIYNFFNAQEKLSTTIIVIDDRSF